MFGNILDLLGNDMKRTWRFYVYPIDLGFPAIFSPAEVKMGVVDMPDDVKKKLKEEVLTSGPVGAVETAVVFYHVLAAEMVILPTCLVDLGKSTS